MAKLAAWRVDTRRDEDGSQWPEPQKVERSCIELERHLEDWIVNDVTLIGEGPFNNEVQHLIWMTAR